MNGEKTAAGGMIGTGAGERRIPAGMNKAVLGESSVRTGDSLYAAGDNGAGPEDNLCVAGENAASSRDSLYATGYNGASLGDSSHDAGDDGAGAWGSGGKDDMFEEKNVVPMAPVLSDPFDSDDYIYEIKFDGMRCIGYYDGGTVLRNRVNRDITPLFPELQEINRQFKKKCIVDSEIVVLNSGKPDYSRLNRRRFLENRMRITRMSQIIPATLIAYDILYLDGKPITDLPLMERKQLLEKNTIESGRLAISRYVEGSGTTLFNRAVKEELEGIVAKKKDGIYVQGRSRLWLKSKRKQDIDLLLCGYLEGKGFLFCDDQLRYRIAIRSVDRRTFDFLLEYIKKHRVGESPLREQPAKFEGAMWARPELYCVVEYMQEMESGYLREAVFKGVKADL